MSYQTGVITCTRRLEWDAAHRVLRHESKCASLHGHRYVAEITCQAPKLDPVGRVVDFGVIKEVVGKWIDDNWDHTTLYNDEDTALADFVAAQGKRPGYRFFGEPTAENIASELLLVTQRLLRDAGSAVTVTNVKIFETPNCSATIQLVEVE